MEEEVKKNSTRPFVLGLLSVIFLCVPGIGMVIALVLGIIGLVMTVNARKTASDALLSAAFILSIIGVAVAGVGVVLVLVSIGFVTTMAGSLMGSFAEALRYF